jgi:hypothetical protein
MKHIIELDSADLAKLFAEGLELPEGQGVTIKALRGNIPKQESTGDLIKDFREGIRPEPVVDKAKRKYTKVDPVFGQRSVDTLASGKKFARTPKAAGNYPCEECGRGFTSAHGLHVHSYRAHKKASIIAEVPANPGEPLLTCDECGDGRPFRDAQALTTHRKFQHNTEKNVCRPCGKTFDSAVSLGFHQQDFHGVKKIA